MFTVKVDPHTHTFFSGHAYSTIEENAIHAAQKGMEAIGMTDHFSPLFSQGGELFRDFGSMLNMKALPKVIHGVRVLSGVEIDIVDFDGHLAAYDSYISQDIQISACEKLLSTREIAIASVHHFNGSRSGSILQNTHMYINVLRNPGIDIIGHCGRAGLPFEIDEVLKVANEEGKMIEINEHSFDFGEPIIGVCRRIALRCAELGVPIVVSSDAHSAFYVGDFKKALAMLDEIEFPEGLVANLTLEKLLATIEKRKRRANVIQPI